MSFDKIIGIGVLIFLLYELFRAIRIIIKGEIESRKIWKDIREQLKDGD